MDVRPPLFPLALLASILLALVLLLLLLLFPLLSRAPLVPPTFKPDGRRKTDQVHPDGPEQRAEMQAEFPSRGRVEKDDLARHDVVVKWEDHEPLVEWIQHRQGLERGGYITCSSPVSSLSCYEAEYDVGSSLILRMIQTIKNNGKN